MDLHGPDFSDSRDPNKIFSDFILGTRFSILGTRIGFLTPQRKPDNI